MSEHNHFSSVKKSDRLLILVIVSIFLLIKLFINKNMGTMFLKSLIERRVVLLTSVVENFGANVPK